MCKPISGQDNRQRPAPAGSELVNYRRFNFNEWYQYKNPKSHNGMLF